MRKNSNSILTAWLRDTRGVATIEFAFMAAVFLLSLMGVTEYSRILWIRNSVQHAADETAHYAMVHTTATQDELVNYAKQAAAPLDASGVSVAVTWDNTSTATFVTILTSYQTALGVPFLPQETVTLVGRARVPQLS